MVAHYLNLGVSDIFRRLWTEGRRKQLVSGGPTWRPVSASYCLRTSAWGIELGLRCGGSAVEKHTRPFE